LVVDPLVNAPGEATRASTPRPWHRPAPPTARIRRRHRTHTSSRAASSSASTADASAWLPDTHLSHEGPGTCGAGEQAYACPGAARRVFPNLCCRRDEAPRGKSAGIQHLWASN
jgi:hypothetical protein